MNAPAEGGINGPVQPRNPFSSLVFIALIIYFMSGSGDDLAEQNRLRDSLRAAKNEYGNYTAWLNGTETNFVQASQPSSLPPLLKTVLPEYPAVDATQASFWKNLTGFHHGIVSFHNLSALSPDDAPWVPLGQEYMKDVNLTDSNELLGTSDWSSMTKVSMRVGDTNMMGFDDLQAFKGQAELSNAEESLKLQFSGVHIATTGWFYAVGTPKGIEPDIRQLSAIVPTTHRNSTAHAVAKQLEERMERIEQSLFSGSSDEGKFNVDAGSGCPFLIYGRLAPSPVSAGKLAELEDEMQNPTGIRTVARPPMRLDGILLSPRCGFLLELKEVTGLRADHFWRKAETYSGLVSLLYIGLLILLVRQMEITRTPAAVSAVSRWVFVLQGVMDSFSFTTHAMFGVLSKSKASLSILAPAFLACILSLMFEVRFTSLIHRIQAPEDSAMLTAPATSTTSTTTQGSSTAREERSRPTPRFMRIRRLLNSMTDPDTKFWAILLFLFVFIIQLTISSPLMLTLIGLLHSFWAPQIVRNITKGTRKAMGKTYVVGTSFLRVLLVLYIFACPENILFSDTNRYVYILVLWIVLQVLVLLGQEYFGSSFFIPRGWITLPERYDYHPMLPVPDAEAPGQSFGDCSICMEPISPHPEGMVVGSGGEKQDSTHTVASPSQNLLLGVGIRRSYALTPCSHIMHTACLERWMAVKSVCPTCRTPLPPL